MDELGEALKAISTGWIPRGWKKNPFSGELIGHFARKRSDGRSIRNLIEVKPGSPPLVFKSLHCLGINWKAIERECSKAQKQIRDRLKREPEPGKVARLVFMFLTKNLIDRYFSDKGELADEIDRRVLSKFPELSAVAFCRISDAYDIPQPSGPFLLFHTRNPDLPPVPRRAFNDEFSVWMLKGEEAT